MTDLEKENELLKSALVDISKQIVWVNQGLGHGHWKVLDAYEVLAALDKSKILEEMENDEQSR